ncbi:hypothetical protein [Psychrobacter sp. I-STPA10]|uniref:hypothetical protein n=1 Tax=Psychrobacter sp. I-STPA10 TaxID=2585769 RepID=UPI001E42D66F|nr:hypothetical protein [Psychrobacter sp. I-STPA10]
MTQILQRLQLGNRNTPTAYRFGSREILTVHANGAAEICNLTGEPVHVIGWDGIRNMGYCPAKLLRGETVDQFLDTPSVDFKQMAFSVIGTLALMAFLASAMVLVGNITGCTKFIVQQAEKDVAVSTVYPRINNEEGGK